MNRYIKYMTMPVLGAVLLGTLTGCEDFLTVNPQDKPVIETYYTSVDRIRMSCAALYSEFEWKNYAHDFQWKFDMQWGYWAYAEGAHGNAPIAQGANSQLALKFEANIGTWVDCPMLMWFQQWSPNGAISPDDNYAQCHWKPYIKNGAYTDAATGGWRTFTIPLTEFKYNKDESADNLAIDDIAKYTDFNIMVFGACATPGPLNIKMDNFRIVRIN